MSELTNLTVAGIRDGFRKGMDLYFRRHDGQAVTCDDFVAAMADAIEAMDDEEKQKIGRQYLIPKQLEANGMQNTEITFNDQAVRELIHHYTKEAGVRSLERAVSSVVRKLAREYVKDGTVTEFALWNPEELGALAAEATARAVLNAVRAARALALPGLPPLPCAADFA